MPLPVVIVLIYLAFVALVILAIWWGGASWLRRHRYLVGYLAIVLNLPISIAIERAMGRRLKLDDYLGLAVGTAFFVLVVYVATLREKRGDKRNELRGS